jgi:hypothetical protein
MSFFIIIQARIVKARARLSGAGAMAAFYYWPAAHTSAVKPRVHMSERLGPVPTQAMGTPVTFSMRLM